MKNKVAETMFTRNPELAIRRKLKVYLYIIFTILIIQGCAATPTPQTPQKTGHWETRTRQTGNAKFSVSDPNMRIIDDHTVEVFGRIIESAYEIETFRVFIGGRYESKERITVKWHNWMPSRVLIRTPYGKYSAEVSSGGVFRTTIKTPSYEQEYFRRPSAKKNYTATSELKSVEVEPISPPDGIRFRAQGLAEIPIWYYKYTPVPPEKFDVEKAVNRFADQNIATVIIVFQDKESRLPLTPTVRITAITTPSNQRLIDRCTELGYNKKEAEKIIEYLDEYVNIKENLEQSSQTVIFKGMVGSTYRINASHGKYLSFSGIINIDKKPQIRKKVLLVEKGKKIRLETINDAEGGEIIDGP
ncbi:MAG: hypothetical protein V3W31_03890 [Thermodesulfobacteriota bacterium]